MLTRHKPESVQNGTPRNESRMSNLDTRAMSNPYFQVGRWDCTDELEGCQFSAPHTSVSVPNFEEIQTLHYTCVYEVAITCTQRHDMHNDEFAHVLSSVIELANRVDLTRLRQHHSIDNFATHVLTFRFILDLLRQTYQEYIKGSIENNSFEHVEFTFNNCMDGTHGMATCFKPNKKHSHLCYILDISQAERSCNGRTDDTKCVHDKITMNDRVLSAAKIPDNAVNKQFSASILNDVYGFDSSLFHISQSETLCMDPQQRLLLLAAADLYLSNTRVCQHDDSFCVHVGVSWNDFEEIRRKYSADFFSTYDSTGTSISVASGRIAYYFDFKGCAVTIDTACSSSLVALHQSMYAAGSLRESSALVCGINLILTTTMTHRFQLAGMMSSEHRCMTFDARADGYVRSEACNIVLLHFNGFTKTHRNVLRHDVHMSCVVNQDGTSTGLTAPNGTAQRNLMNELLSDVYNPSKHVGAKIHAHGTGTPLGDPIEVFAINSALSFSSLCRLYVSEKSMRGHTEPASGLCSTILAFVSGAQCKLHGQPHLQQLNNHILTSVDESIFQRSLHSSFPLTSMASVTTVSSFAFQGTNAMASLTYIDKCSIRVIRNTSGLRSLVKLETESPVRLPYTFSCLSIVNGKMIQLTSMIHDKTLKRLLDHRVADMHLMPATGHLELERELTKCALVRNEPYLLTKIAFMLPLKLDESNQLITEMNTHGRLRVGCGSGISNYWCSTARLQIPVGRAWCTDRTFYLTSKLVSRRFKGATATIAGTTPILDSQNVVNPCIQDASLQCSAYVLNTSAFASDTTYMDCVSLLKLPTTIQDVIVVNQTGKILVRSTHVDMLQKTQHVTESNNSVTSNSSSNNKTQTWIHRLLCKVSTVRMKAGLRTRTCLELARLLYHARQQRVLISNMQNLREVGSLHAPELMPIMREMGRKSMQDINSASASLCAVALLQACGARARVSGAHVRANDIVHEDASAAPAVCGSCVRATVQSSAQERSEPLVLSVASAPHTAPARALRSIAAGASIAGALCVERLLPAFGRRTPAASRDGAATTTASPAPKVSSVFVTGGLGALGQTSAAWYAHRGVRHAYLTGRRGRGESLLLRWSSRGGTDVSALHVLRVDACATDEASYGGARAHARVRAHGVLHAGGVLRDSLTARQSASAHRYVWSSKVVSAHALLRQCVGVERGARHIALFSSVAALLGSPGQCNYSAANAALDARAAHEWCRGYAVQSVQWGAWDGAGMALTNASVLRNARTTGIGVLDPQAGLGAVHVALQGASVTGRWRAIQGVLAVVPFQWSVLARAQRSRALIAEYRAESARSSAPVAVHPGAEEDAARDVSDESVRQIVASAVTRALGRDVSVDASLMEEGLDSLAAVELGGALQKETGVNMPATLAFDYPTITAISGYLKGAMLARSRARQSSGAASSAARTRAASGAVAHSRDSMPGIASNAREILGLAPVVMAIRRSVRRLDADDREPKPARHGGSALFSSFVRCVMAERASEDRFDTPSLGRQPSATARVVSLTKARDFTTQALDSMPKCNEIELSVVSAVSSKASGAHDAVRVNNMRHACGEVCDPQSSKSHEFVARHLVQFGYFIERSLFDGEQFSVTAHEARLMDPQQRVLLENALAATSATPHSAPKPATAVSVGAWTSQYADMCRVYEPTPGPYSGVASALSVLCGRVSYTFGMRGPSVCVDTACSSSLVAAHVASSHLRDGSCEDALVAGVSVNVGIGTFLVATAASMLSFDGRCKTLDASADGYAKGECCVVLRVSVDGASAGAPKAPDLPNAESPSLALLEQTGVNQDGRSSSLTAPNGPSQQALVADALLRSGLHGDALGRLEMHGTGTSLGDPIEVGAALEVLAPPTRADRAPSRGPALTLEGVKPRAGHCEPGAGAVGLLFAMANLTERAVASLVHLRQLNPHVEAATRRNAPSPHARAPVLARQGMPRPDDGASEAGAADAARARVRRSGVSGFAFQGTNAHAIMARGPGQATAPGYTGSTHTAARAWERQRHWCAPERHCLIESVRALHPREGDSSALARSCVRLCRSASLAGMLDHAVGLRTLLPGTAHVEICRAMAGALADQPLADISLSHVSFAAPLELRAPTTDVLCDVTPQGVVRVGVRVSSSSAAAPFLAGALSRRSTSRITASPAHLSRGPAMPALDVQPCVHGASWLRSSQRRGPGAEHRVYGDIRARQMSTLSAAAYHSPPAVLDAALHALSACAPPPGSDATEESPHVPATIGGVRTRGGHSDMYRARFALATAPPERGERNASTRRSRHHLWDWSSLSAAHRGCVVHALESRRLGGLTTNSFYHSFTSTQAYKLAHIPRPDILSQSFTSMKTINAVDKASSTFTERSSDAMEIFNAVQREILEILSTLTTSPVSLDDTLASHGLDSLGIAYFFIQVGKRFNVEVTVDSLGTNTTVSSIVHQISQMLSARVIFLHTKDLVRERKADSSSRRGRSTAITSMVSAYRRHLQSTEFEPKACFARGVLACAIFTIFIIAYGYHAHRFDMF